MQGLVIAAWILTFLIPPIGLILDIILTAKNRMCTALQQW